MQELRIIGFQITDRIKEAGLTQKILTRHAHVIKSRLGFHEVSDSVCSRVGVMLLQLRGNPEDCDKLEDALSELTGDPKEFTKPENELLKIQGMEVKKIVFRE